MVRSNSIAAISETPRSFLSRFMVVSRGAAEPLWNHPDRILERKRPAAGRAGLDAAAGLGTGHAGLRAVAGRPRSRTIAGDVAADRGVVRAGPDRTHAVRRAEGRR